MHNIFNEAINYWILNDNIISIDFYGNMTDFEKMKTTVNVFCGQYEQWNNRGCIKTINIWLVKVKRLLITRDGIKIPVVLLVQLIFRL